MLLLPYSISRARDPFWSLVRNELLLPRPSLCYDGSTIPVRYKRHPIVVVEVSLNILSRDLAAIFQEWDKRWRENPDEFTDLVTHLTKDTPMTYGQKCAPYFIKLAEDLDLLA